MTVTRAHALAADELNLLRDRVPAQRTDLFLTFWPQFVGSQGDPFHATVWTAQVAAAPASNDRVYQIAYNLGSGAADFANVNPDMTCYVGTVAGAYDLGIVRVRMFEAGATGVAGTMDIGETSEIAWVVGAHLTVIDEYGLWPRPLYIDGAGAIYMDRGYYDEVAAANVDGSYTDQHRYPDPVPNLLPDPVVWLPAAGGNIRVGFDATDSFTLDGGALTYVWTFPGAAATFGLATATPWAEYNAAGVYDVNCTVTRNYPPASTFTGRRKVFVFDPNDTTETGYTRKFELLDCSGSRSGAGWSFRVRMWDDALRSEVVDRAKVILFARDWFDGLEDVIGPMQTDAFGGQYLRANVVCVGWVDGESIKLDNERGYVEFTVEGPKFWFDQMTGFPHGVENSDGVPTDWFEYQDLMVRDGLWSFLHWRSTATRMMDVLLPTDTREIAVFASPLDSLWQQLESGAREAILAEPLCDRYGTLHVEIDTNWEFNANRVGIPIVWDVQRSDWREEIDIQRRTVTPVSLTDMSGVYYLNAANADAFFSLSPGHIFRRYGRPQRLDRLALFALQATNNQLAGLIHDAANAEYPNVDYRLSGNWRVCDIAPRQRITQTLLATDTARGIEWTAQKLLPRALSYLFEDGALLVDMTCEEETGEAIAVDGDPPQETPDPPTTYPTPPPNPPEPPPVVEYGVVVMNQDQIAVSFNFFDQANPDWYDMSGGVYGGLFGVYQNVAVRGVEAWLTTRDDANPNTTGLYYCSDISAAVTGGLTWTLIKTVTQATADTGYIVAVNDRCHLGSLYMRQDGTVICMVHSEGNRVPPAGGQSGYYTGVANVFNINLLPQVGGNSPYQHQIFDGTNHCTWGWAGNFYIAVRCSTVNQTTLVYQDGVGYIDFDPPGTFNAVCCNSGWVQHWNTILGSTVTGGGVWNPAAPEAIITPRAGIGIVADTQGGSVTPYLYTPNGAPLYDLYLRGVGLIGDASSAVTGFGVGMEGGYAEFFPGDTDQIVWVLGSQGAFASVRVVIYTDDQGTTWVNKGGAGATSLQNALGGVANWTGWNAVAPPPPQGAGCGNSIVRIFQK